MVRHFAGGKVGGSKGQPERSNEVTVSANRVLRGCNMYRW